MTSAGRGPWGTRGSRLHQPRTAVAKQLRVYAGASEEATVGVCLQSSVSARPRSAGTPVPAPSWGTDGWFRDARRSPGNDI